MAQVIMTCSRPLLVHLSTKDNVLTPTKEAVPADLVSGSLEARKLDSTTTNT